MRACTKCGKVLPAVDFQLDKAQIKTKGRKYSCRSCVSEYRMYDPKGRAVRAWQDLNRSPRKSALIRMTKDDFMSWAIPAFTIWFLENPKVKANPELIKPSGYYTIGNLKVVKVAESNPTINHKQRKSKAVKLTELKRWSECSEYKPRKRKSPISNEHVLQILSGLYTVLTGQQLP